MYTQPQKKFRARDENEVLEEIRRCGERLIVKRVFLADGDAWYCRPAGCSRCCRRFASTCRRWSGYPATACRATCAGSRSTSCANWPTPGCEWPMSAPSPATTKCWRGSTRARPIPLPGCAGKAWRGGDQSFGDDPQRSGRNDPERAARGQLRAPDERRPAGVPVDPGGEFPYRRAAFPCCFADFEALDRRALFVEVERLLQGLELEDTVFRSDHASNYLVLKGELGADKARLLAEVRQAIEQPQHAALRQEWQRGL